MRGTWHIICPRMKKWGGHVPHQIAPMYSTYHHIVYCGNKKVFIFAEIRKCFKKKCGSAILSLKSGGGTTLSHVSGTTPLYLHRTVTSPAVMASRQQCIVLREVWNSLTLGFEYCVLRNGICQLPLAICATTLSVNLCVWNRVQQLLPRILSAPPYFQQNAHYCLTLKLLIVYNVCDNRKC